MPSQNVIFQASDVEQLYRGGKPSSWEQLIERADKAPFHRHNVSPTEAREIVFGLELLRDRGSAVPGTARECYDQLLEVLEPLPEPRAVP